MAYCPNGASPTAGAYQTQIALNMLGVGTGVFDIVSGIWPLLAASAVMARYSAADLCNANPDDPGPLSLETMQASLTAQGFPNATAPLGTLERWTWDHVFFWYFSQNCVCNAGGSTIQPPQNVVAPPGAQPFPTAHDDQPQLNRIEHNQTVSSSGLNTLYLLGQDARNLVSDLWLRSVQNVLNHTAAGQWTMVGEGYQDLQTDPTATSTGEIDRLGMIVQLTAIPNTVARRGTTYQRLYGVGSVEWDASPPSFPFRHLIAQRDSLHYDNQWLLAPQWVQTNRVYWRLKPGVQAIAYEVPRSAGSPVYPSPNAHNSAWTPASGVPVPPNWSDSPFYPLPASRRIYALGSPP